MTPNGKTLLTMGTFDPPTYAHAAFFKQCELYCENLIIGVNSDRFVEQYRGAPPSRLEDYRLEVIRRWHTAKVVLNDGPGRDLILEHRPDIIAIGSDWVTRDFHQQIDFSPNDFDYYNVTLIYIPYQLGSYVDASATELKAFYKGTTK